MVIILSFFREKRASKVILVLLDKMVPRYAIYNAALCTSHSVGECVHCFMQGSRGDKGSAGEKGDTGEPGINGGVGPPGAVGEKGAKGIVGVPGFVGTRGVPGADVSHEHTICTCSRKSWKKV